ncbi:MAG: hypothetical protein MUP64_06690, partial [Anaerolineae bacterium]|nr:hypothetical protein [Anaerolineae bacterium]
AAEDHKVDVLGEGMVNDEVQGTQEVPDAGAEPGLRVEATVVLHPKVQIGEMEEFDHGTDARL